MVKTMDRQVAFITAGQAQDPRTWSGIPFFMARSLSTHAGETVFIGPLGHGLRRVMKAVGRVRQKVTGRRQMPHVTWRMAKHCARVAEAKLNGKSADAVFAPASSVALADLKTDLPVIYTSDATAHLMFDYYPRFTNLGKQARREVDEIERAAITRADVLLYPTNWAAQSAIEHYGADPAKVHVLSYGANLDIVPSREEVLAPRERSGLKLLFVGVNWSIKGGAIAVEAVRCLRREGVEAELTIVGCVPPEPVEDPGITVIPFLDKNDPEQRRKLGDLYFEADFMILPTRCECYGIVFCEASALGVPSITTATGGVPEVVRDGVNGYTLPHADGGEAYAAKILELLDDPDRRSRLRETSRDEYEQRLNWDVWGREASRLIEDAVASGARR